jgi:hypothetical protein
METAPVPVRETIVIRTLSDVVDLMNQINGGIDHGTMSEGHARIKNVLTKNYISVAQLVIQNKRLERGHRPEKELLLKPVTEEGDPRKCACGQNVQGVKFCPECGTPVAVKR